MTEQERIEFCRQLKLGDRVDVIGQWGKRTPFRVVGVGKKYMDLQCAVNDLFRQRATIDAFPPYSASPGPGMARSRERLVPPKEMPCPPTE
jgi:hypothetical protein